MKRTESEMETEQIVGVICPPLTICLYVLAFERSQLVK